MSCLQVSVSVLPLELKPIISRHDAPLGLSVLDVSNHLKVTCGIVCSISDIERYRRILVASDEIFILLDGKMFVLLK